MSKISKEGYEQIQVIKNALNSMYDKLDKDVYVKSGTKYQKVNPFEAVQTEFEAIAGIVELANSWEEIGEQNASE